MAKGWMDSMGRKIFTKENQTIFVIVQAVFSPEVQTRAEGRQKFTGTVWLKADENFWGL